MSITLTPELERIVQESVASGRYGSPMEFVNEAIHLIVERDRFMEIQRESLRRDIKEGLDQIERGEVELYDPDQMMERVERHLRQNP